jgi:transcriptional regulator with XRE-family HTH domain
MHMSAANDLGNRITELMKRHGWGVVEMARECGVARGSLEKYLRGDAKPGFDTIVKICRRTSVSPNWLVMGNEMDREALYDAMYGAAVHSAHNMSEKVRELIKLGRSTEEINDFLTKRGTINVASDCAKPWAHAFTDSLWKKFEEPASSPTGDNAPTND